MLSKFPLCLHAKELSNTNPVRGIYRQPETPLCSEDLSSGFDTVAQNRVGIFSYTEPSRPMRSSPSYYTTLQYTTNYLYRSEFLNYKTCVSSTSDFEPSVCTLYLFREQRYSGEYERAKYHGISSGWRQKIYELLRAFRTRCDDLLAYWACNLGLGRHVTY